MKVSRALLIVTVTLSLAGVAMVSCRRIHPPPPTSRPAVSQPAAEEAVADAPALSKKFIWYTVQRGDTARRIAVRLLVDGQDGDITKNNPEITDWRKLSVGMKLRLPTKKLKDKTILDSPTVQFAPDPPPRPVLPDEDLPHPYP